MFWHKLSPLDLPSPPSHVLTLVLAVCCTLALFCPSCRSAFFFLSHLPSSLPPPACPSPSVHWCLQICLVGALQTGRGRCPEGVLAQQAACLGRSGKVLLPAFSSRSPQLGHRVSPRLLWLPCSLRASTLARRTGCHCPDNVSSTWRPWRVSDLREIWARLPSPKPQPISFLEPPCPTPTSTG